MRFGLGESSLKVKGSIFGAPDSILRLLAYNRFMRFGLIFGFVFAIVGVANAEVEAHHIRHFRTYDSKATGFNRLVLRGIDLVQGRNFNGGGYFIGVKADPPESPICYPLELGGNPLLNPPRGTSYCSGASYVAFIEAMGLYLHLNPRPIKPEQVEALRMQEPDGGRREDRVKAWGWWNADGFGSHYALVQLMKAGVRVKPENAMPGDFMNISWKGGPGHSVVFLEWRTNAEGIKGLVYWSSQKGTDGLGDQWVPLSRIDQVCIVRCTEPENVLNFDPLGIVERKVEGDRLGE